MALFRDLIGFSPLSITSLSYINIHDANGNAITRIQFNDINNFNISLGLYLDVNHNYYCFTF